MTPNSSPLTPYIALIGAGYWGKNLVRNFHELGVLKTICDQSSPGRPAPRPGDAGPRCLQTLLNTASSKSPWPHLSLTERRFLEAGIGTRGVRRKDKADPVYYNTGSCVHPRCITGIEITAAPPKDDGPIRPHFTLVKWGYLEEKPGRLPRKNRGDSLFSLFGK